MMFLKKMGGDIRRAPSRARASSDEGWERTSEDASVMTYSSARAAVEDAGAGARAGHDCDECDETWLRAR